MEIKPLTLDEVNQMYTEAEACDSELFAEQRSNLLLIAGDHYTRQGGKFWNRIRNDKDLSQEQKLRLTKNHLQRITKKITNNITSYAPSVAVTPKNETELADQKSAELNNSVWQDFRYQDGMRAKTRQWAEDFIGIGECFAKVWFDPNQGEIVGEEQGVDEQGNLAVDASGNPAGGGKTVFRGRITAERFFGFNVFRAPSAKDFETSPWVGLRKMVDIKTLEKKFAGDPEKLKFIKESTDDTYVVFDGMTGRYRDSKNQVMWREIFFRPCMDYPKGWFVMSTPYGILFQGELPFGIFPMKYAGYDEIPTSPRARSIIKQLRPYQAEVNRSASKMAEHQITLGDDKILTQSGTKLVPGNVLPGVRNYQYTGMTPTILEGRSGAQYLDYMTSQISEMYVVANVEEDDQENTSNGQLDPYAMLFSSIRNKKKFSLYAEKFEQFLVDICKTVLELARNYYTEDMLIPIVGKREALNIAEFKGTSDMDYQIKLEPQSDDIETTMGKQLVLNNLIQYVGNQLTPEQLGQIIRSMPYVSKENLLPDATVNADNADSDILALDRGEFRPAQPYEEHKYMISRLTHRMKKRDYQFLPQNVQMMYEEKKKQHEQIEAQQQQEIQAAKAGYIPTGGYLVVVDFYTADPKDPNKTRRARIPYESLAWLLDRLEKQGLNEKALEGMHQSSLADIAKMIGLPEQPQQQQDQQQSQQQQAPQPA